MEKLFKNVSDITYLSELNSPKQLTSFDFAQDVILSLSKDYVHFIP